MRGGALDVPLLQALVLRFNGAPLNGALCHIVAACLQRDPAQRLSAPSLLRSLVVQFSAGLVPRGPAAQWADQCAGSRIVCISRASGLAGGAGALCGCARARVRVCVCACVRVCVCVSV